MGWFSEFRRKRLTVAWEYRAKGILWQLLPSTEGCLVGEDRDVEEKSVSFFCVEQETGRALWQHLHGPERWWITLAAAHRSVLLLHGYAQPDMPEPRQIYAYDLLTGRSLWSNPEIRFLFALHDRVYATREQFGQDLFLEVNLVTGETVQERTEEEIQSLEREAAREQSEVGEFPATVESLEQLDASIGRCIQRILSRAHLPSSITYMTRGNLIVASYYDRPAADPTDPHYKQIIAIADRETCAIHFEDVMAERVTALHSDTFFGIGDSVFYINEKKHLRAVHLTTESRADGVH